MNENTIGKDYTIGGLIKFCAAPVISRLFIAILQTLDDGLFISRYCGQYALAAFSIAMPYFMIIDAVGMLIGGIGTKCSVLMGEKKQDEANRAFGTTCLFTVLIGLLFTLFLTFFREDLLRILGATDILMPYALAYLNISRFYTPLVLVNNIFARFYTIAGKPQANVFTTVLSTISNFFFDYLFIVKLNTGIVGTAYANLISNIVIGLFGLLFFIDSSKEVHFTKLVDKPFVLIKEVFKLGRAGALTSLALSLNAYIANIVLLKYAYEDGVAAFTIVGNVQFMFMNMYFGFLGCTAPLVSYAYGEKNKEKLNKLLKQILSLITGLGLIIIVVYYVLSKPIVNLYLLNEDSINIRHMLEKGMLISPYALFVFAYNFIVQELLSALTNYKESTILSMLENMLFSNLTIVIMPYLFGLDAVWYAFLVQEILTLLFTFYFVYKNKDQYGYGKSKKALALENKN